ncbi:hypothetical protein FB45DRAFT_1054556 [Roridomyces roridus]|uniref:MYND-type domain-containing protein n=1 Tax=Roridomyces roridus TaxID=1738132 RepID=A0AAD7C3I1_9AGAR|nr:hypothetical protein FB45DRAFT_1054556 [Roridomyces roridus]
MKDHLATVFPSNSDFINFLVAAMRSRDLPTRCLSQYTLIQLYTTSPRDEIKPVPCAEPNRSLPGSKSFLEQFNDGIDELYALVHVFDLVQALDEKIPQSHSEFGYALSHWIQRNSLLIRGRLEKGRAEDTHLTKILETCEAALRTDRSTRADLAADIIHTELLLAHEKDKASSFAHSCIEKHPSVAYFYYAMALIPNSVIPVILFAEKGLQCHPMSELIRLELLGLATTGVYSIIATMNSSPLPNDEHLRKVNVLVQKGLSHAKAFLDSKPVEHPRTAMMGAMSILLTFLSRGHTLNDEELQTLRTKFAATCQLRLPKEYFTTLEEIFRRMPTAWRRWEAAMTRQPQFLLRSSTENSNQPGAPDTAADPNEDDIVEWLQKLNMSHKYVIDSEMNGLKFGAKRDCGEVLLHACTCCGKRSAVLKRCAGCQRARYCNDTCQRSDWKNHRQICRASRGA